MVQWGKSIERIIPARAGFTLTHGYSHIEVEDHPRSRGVYYTWKSVGLSYIGSSPLARGLHPHIVDEAGEARIIPARAGFTPDRVIVDRVL